MNDIETTLNKIFDERFCVCKNVIIPSNVYDVVRSELKLAGSDDNLLSSVRLALKKHRFFKYYSYYHHIYNVVTLTSQPHVTPDTRQKIFEMIRMIQMLKVSTILDHLDYILHKLFLILEMPNHARYFTLPKTIMLCEYDKIWKKTCDELGWRFDSSFFKKTTV